MYTDVCTIGPSMPSDGGTYSDPYASHDGVSFAIDPADASDGLNAAIDAAVSAGVAGFDLYVHPSSTTIYTFQDFVDVDIPCKIHWPTNTQARITAGNRMFRFTKANSGIEGLRVTDSPNGDGITYILVDDNGTAGATHGFKAFNNRFNISNQKTDAVDCAAIRILGKDPAISTVPTLMGIGDVIAYNEIMFNATGQQVEQFNGTSRRGWSGLQMQNRACGTVLGNTVRGSDAALATAGVGSGYCHSAFRLDTCQFFVVMANKAIHLNATGSNEGTLVNTTEYGSDIFDITMSDSNVGTEGGHSIYIGNYAEACFARYVYSITGGIFKIFLGNAAGRCLRVRAGVHMGAAAPSGKGCGTGISAFWELHNIKGPETGGAAFLSFFEGKTFSYASAQDFVIGGDSFGLGDDANLDDLYKAVLARNLQKIPIDAVSIGNLSAGFFMGG